MVRGSKAPQQASELGRLELGNVGNGLEKTSGYISPRPRNIQRFLKTQYLLSNAPPHHPHLRTNLSKQLSILHPGLAQGLRHD